jgi:NADPH-dependent glutamate synthase beta subunit-like oxidoreductase
LLLSVFYCFQSRNRIANDQALCDGSRYTEGAGFPRRSRGPAAESRSDSEPIPGTEFTLDVDLVLLALGFTGPTKSGLIEQAGLKLDLRGNLHSREGRSAQR